MSRLPKEVVEEKKVLNVGGNSKAIDIPQFFNYWQHILLDIDKNTNPDVLCDARNLNTLEKNSYDAVYCAHMLEHFFYHEILQVLGGMNYILKDDGFLMLRVPDIAWVLKTMFEKGLDLTDELYVSQVGPILVSDVLWGFHKEIMHSGNDYFAHKYGFTPKSLKKFVSTAGFKIVIDAVPPEYEIVIVAFKEHPTPFHEALFNSKFNVANNN
jgi:hypothetical protein